MEKQTHRLRGRQAQVPQANLFLGHPRNRLLSLQGNQADSLHLNLPVSLLVNHLLSHLDSLRRSRLCNPSQSLQGSQLISPLVFPLVSPLHILLLLPRASHL